MSHTLIFFHKQSRNNRQILNRIFIAYVIENSAMILLCSFVRGFRGIRLTYRQSEPLGSSISTRAQGLATDIASYHPGDRLEQAGGAGLGCGLGLGLAGEAVGDGLAEGGKLSIEGGVDGAAGVGFAEGTDAVGSALVGDGSECAARHWALLVVEEGVDFFEYRKEGLELFLIQLALEEGQLRILDWSLNLDSEDLSMSYEGIAQAGQAWAFIEQ